MSFFFRCDGISRSMLVMSLHTFWNLMLFESSNRIFINLFGIFTNQQSSKHFLKGNKVSWQYNSGERKGDHPAKKRIETHWEHQVCVSTQNRLATRGNQAQGIKDPQFTPADSGHGGGADPQREAAERQLHPHRGGEGQAGQHTDWPHLGEEEGQLGTGKHGQNH